MNFLQQIQLLIFSILVALIIRFSAYGYEKIELLKKYVLLIEKENVKANRKT